jgi:FKBP-type peptidyl-prolyl cis-trans isomerase
MRGMKTRIRPLSFLVPVSTAIVFALSIVAAPHPASAQPGGCNVPAPSDVKAAPATATKTKSGIASRVLTPGTGKAHPGEYDVVTVRYTGWHPDNGQCFDTSGDKTVSFPLNHVVKGWTEGVALMVAGEKRRFWIPDELCYKGVPDRPQGMLVFDIELVSFKEGPRPPATPPDVAAIPADAKKTASGIGYRVLRKGTGATHPAATSMVTVNYSLWSTDGKFLQSSLMAGQPATFRLNQVIAGWTEGVQLMVEGEKTRFWIPWELAYKGQPDRPQGMLVFEIELLKVAN